MGSARDEAIRLVHHRIPAYEETEALMRAADIVADLLEGDLLERLLVEEGRALPIALGHHPEGDEQ